MRQETPVHSSFHFMPLLPSLCDKVLHAGELVIGQELVPLIRDSPSTFGCRVQYAGPGRRVECLSLVFGDGRMLDQAQLDLQDAVVEIRLFCQI